MNRTRSKIVALLLLCSGGGWVTFSLLREHQAGSSIVPNTTDLTTPTGPTDNPATAEPGSAEVRATERVSRPLAPSPLLPQLAEVRRQVLEQVLRNLGPQTQPVESEGLQVTGAPSRFSSFAEQAKLSNEQQSAVRGIYARYAKQLDMLSRTNKPQLVPRLDNHMRALVLTTMNTEQASAFTASGLPLAKENFQAGTLL